jgi:HEAT repeat protein
MAVSLDSLNDSDPRTRIRAIKALPDRGDVKVLDRLIDLVQNDPETAVRGAAILGIGDMISHDVVYTYDPETGEGDEDLDGDLSGASLSRVYRFLLEVCRDPERALDEKRFAIEVLGLFSTDTVEEAIAALYANPEKEAKRSALVAMGRNGSTRWTDILQNELGNPDSDLQLEAIEVVGELGISSLGKDLWRLTYADDKETILAALWALGQTGWDGAFERLDELALHDDPDISEAADEALDEWALFNRLASELEPDTDMDLL